MRPIPDKICAAMSFSLLFMFSLSSARACGEQEVRTEVGRLPGAIPGPPSWLLNDENAPFDLKGYFAAPPGAENAARLYLEGLAEFHGGMAVCFPAGEENSRREARATERERRIEEYYKRSPGAAKPPSSDEVRTLVHSLSNGFSRIAEAQKRPACIFETGLGVDAPLPHLLAARQYARAGVLKSRVEIEAGRLDDAIEDAERILRLARDIQHRGAGITQIVAVVLEDLACRSIILPILDHSAVGMDHCNRLLRILSIHHAHFGPRRKQWLKGEYLLGRSTLHRLSSGADREKLLANYELWTQPENAAKSELKRALDNEKTRIIAASVLRLSKVYARLLSSADSPYTERTSAFDRIADEVPAHQPDGYLVLVLHPDVARIDESVTRSEAFIRATIALTAARRWRVGHDEFPPNLDSASMDPVMKAALIDPYDGRPLRYRRDVGKCLVYSVGKDGRDDDGRIDNRFNTRPGDLIYSIQDR